MNNLIKKIEFSKIFNFKGLMSYKEGSIISRNNNEAGLENRKNNEHCNNFATHCCLGCDRCWGKKYKTYK